MFDRVSIRITVCVATITWLAAAPRRRRSRRGSNFGTSGRRGNGSKRCRSATAGSGRWSSAARAEERLQLNEDSLWLGWPDDNDNPAALPALAKIRELLFAGKYAEAQNAHESHADLSAGRRWFVWLVHDARRSRRSIFPATSRPRIIDASCRSTMRSRG